LMLNRYFTAEFYKKLKGWLKQDGVVATSLMYTQNYMGGEVADYAGSIYKTLKGMFKDVVVYPGGRLYIFASDGEGVLTEDGNTMMARYKARGVESRYFA